MMTNQEFTPVVFPRKKVFKKQDYDSTEYFDEFEDNLSHSFADLDDFLKDKLNYIKELSDMALECGNDVDPEFLLFILSSVQKDLKTFFHFLNQQAIIRIDAIEKDEIVGVNVRLKQGITKEDGVLIQDVHKIKGFWAHISFITNLFIVRFKDDESSKLFDDTVDRMAADLKKKYRSGGAS